MPTAKTSELTRAIERIKTSSYRLTRPRLALLETIFKQKKPFAARDLELKLSGKNGCDSVTIYRSLPVFVELGILEKCDFSDEKTHYEVKHEHHGHHHHHIVCTSCERVDSIETCVIEAQEQLLKKLGYKDLKHRLEFRGLCPSCA